METPSVIRGSTLPQRYYFDGPPLNANAVAKQHRLGNGLLTALPLESTGLLSQLEPVAFTCGEVLCETDSPLTHVYFPTSAIISLKKNGAQGEVAIVGSEGMIGVFAVMGSQLSWCRAVVQCPGAGFKLKADVLRDAFGRPAFMNVLLRYTQALITQITQTAVCNRLHCLNQQFCRRLLAMLDRSSSDELTITHYLIASTLGVRREGVTNAAIKLQKAGIIQYSRGRIVVLDRAGLEAASCECYSVVKREYCRLLANRLH